MTSNDDSRDGKKPAGSSSSGKRPHATLDLKAVEIKDRSDRQARSTSAAPSDGSTQSTSETKTTGASRAESKQQGNVWHEQRSLFSVTVKNKDRKRRTR